MIADDLKALFDSKNLNNRQVAKLSGISESSISRILRKETEDPGFQTIAHLVKTVGGSLDVMTGIASATDPVVALKASYDALLASKGELLAEKDKEIAHRNAQIAEKRRTIHLLSWICLGLFIFFVLTEGLFVFDFLNPDLGWIQRALERMQTGMI